MRQIVLFLLIAGFLSKTSLAQVPDFTQTDCNGVTHRLYDELAAGNAVVLKFCAMWCGPCAVSNPEFEKAWEQLGKGSCKVKFFSMLYEDFDFNITDCADGTSYSDHYGLTMPTLTNIGQWNTGLTGEYVAKYGMRGIPTTFVILPNQQDPANSTVEMIDGALPDLSEWIKAKLALGGFAASITAVGEWCSTPPFSAVLSSLSPTGNTWSTGETGQSITINQSGTYTLSTLLNGCTTSSTKTIEFKQSPAVGIASASVTSMCEGGFFYLNYSKPDNSPSDLMWLWRISDTDGWEELRYAGDGPVRFDYAWFPGVQLQFIVRVRNNDGSCESYSNVVSVSNTSNSPVTIPGTASVSANAVCPGSSFILTYSGGVPGSLWEIYIPIVDQWQIFADASQPIDPNGLANLNQYQTNSDRFRVKSPAGDCYTLSNEVEVNYFPSQPPTVTGPTFTCGGTDQALQINGNYANILWSTGSTSPSITVNPAVTTQYSVSATDEFGCPVAANHTLSVWTKASPLIDLTSPGSVCAGGPVTLSFGGTSSGTPCTNAVTGQYPEEVFTASSCNGGLELITDVGYLSEYSLMNVEKGNYYEFTSVRTYLENIEIYITISSADGNVVYASGVSRAVWKASFTGQIRFYTHGAGCSESQQYVARFVSCHTDPSPFGSFLWMPGGQTTPSITVNPSTTTNYSLVFTEATTGCQSTTTQQIIVGIGAVQLNTTNITCNSATLNWTSAINPTLWELEYKSTANGSKWIKVPVPSASARSATISGLIANQNYNWHIRARCGNPWTQYSTSVTFKTLPSCVTQANETRTLTTATALQEPAKMAENTKAIVMPNPSSTNFRILLANKDLKVPVKLVVSDMLGRVVETRMATAGQTITIGERYISGTYLVTIIQGKTTQQMKLIKLVN